MMSELRATAAPFQPATYSSNIRSTPVTSAVQNKPSDASIMTQQRPRTVRSVPLHERLPLAAPRCAATGLDAGLDASVRRGSVDDLEVRVLVERQELFNATVRRRACEAPMTALTCVTPPPEAAAAAAEDAEAGSPSAMALLPADLLSSLLLSSPETRLIGAQLPPPVATWLPSGLLSTPAPVVTAAAAASVVAQAPPLPSAVAVDEAVEGPAGSRVAVAPPPTSYAQMAARPAKARPAAEPEVSATNGSRATGAAPTTVGAAVAAPGPSVTSNRFDPPLLADPPLPADPPLLAEAEEALHIPVACRGNPMRTALFAACRSNPESRSRRVAQRRARKAYLEARAAGDTALSSDGAAVGPAADARARDP